MNDGTTRASLEQTALEEILAAGRRAVEDADFSAVRRWHEAGGKVLGHFQVYFPEEIAHAAGWLPVKVCGAPIEPERADSHFGSYLCSILKTSLELVVSRRLPLDLFVTHPICDAARNLAGIFGRNFAFPSEILYLPQNPNSRHSATYLAEEYRRIGRAIEAAGGRAIGDDELRRSIAVFDENRRLLRDLYEIKRERPWLLPIDEAYVLVALAGVTPREEHNRLLRHALGEIRARSTRPQDKMRVVFEGGFCEQPPLDMLRILAESCYVVDDDLLIGLRWIETDVGSDGDPWRRLAEAYLERSSYSPVQHDLRKPKERMLLERIRGSHAEAAIVAAAKMCEPGLDEQVAYTKALEEARIPYLVSEFEESMTTFDQLQMQLETFVENVLFHG